MSISVSQTCQHTLTLKTETKPTWSELAPNRNKNNYITTNNKRWLLLLQQRKVLSARRAKFWQGYVLPNNHVVATPRATLWMYHVRLATIAAVTDTISSPICQRRITATTTNTTKSSHVTLAPVLSLAGSPIVHGSVPVCVWHEVHFFQPIPFILHVMCCELKNHNIKDISEC